MFNNRNLMNIHFTSLKMMSKVARMSRKADLNEGKTTSRRRDMLGAIIELTQSFMGINGADSNNPMGILINQLLKQLGTSTSSFDGEMNINIDMGNIIMGMFNSGAASMNGDSTNTLNSEL